MIQLSVQLSEKNLRALQAICSEEGCSPEQYLALCFKRDVESRQDSGWTVRNGWSGRGERDAVLTACAMASAFWDGMASPIDQSNLAG
jgi:hypothetical protein